MWKQVTAVGGTGGAAIAGLTALHGPALVVVVIVVAVLVALLAVWVLAITFSAGAADNWSKWRGAGTPPGPSP